MSDGSGEIIIKGGSCEIHFDDTLYTKDPNDPKKRRHKHDRLKIRKIALDGKTLFESKAPDDGFKGEVRITCEY